MLDLKTSLRGLTRAPLIAAAALLTVTLTLGGTVAVFTLLDAVVLRSLPYRDGDRLVAVWTDVTELTEEVRIQDPLREWTNLDSHRDVRAMSSSLDDLAAFSGWAPAFRADNGMQRIPGAMVTWNGLQVLGVTPVAGRLFTETEGEAASGCSVVIVERFWHRHLAGDAAVIGQEIFLTDDSCTVVGVLPDGFRFPFLPSTEIVRSITATGNDRGAAYLRQFGRLASGVTLEQARVELDTIAASLRAQYPVVRGQRLFVEPLQEALNRGVRDQLALLQGAALFVLAMGIANLASLVIARALARSDEFAVRAALGAGPWRQFRLLWTESFVLAGGGALGGILLASAGVDLLARALPSGLGDTWQIQLGARSLAVAAGVAFLAATVMACLARAALVRSLRRPVGMTGGSRSAGSRAGRRSTAVLVAANFAVALAVAVTGVLLLQSYQRLAAVDPGFATEGVTAGMIGLPQTRYADDAAIVAGYERLVARLEGIPGVAAAGLASSVPLGESNNDTFVLVEGRPTARQDGRAHVWLTRADEGYFDAMGVRVRDGRGFERSDRVDGRRVALVNAAFAREYLDGGPAPGVRVGLGTDVRWFDIVGVVEDVRYFDLTRPESPALYVPAWAEPSRGMYVVVRSPREAMSIVPELRRAVSSFDPEVALMDLRSTAERLDGQLMVPRTISRLTLLFALTALLLAAVGVYGTLTQSVVRRTRELGVRRALGARDSHVLVQVVRQGMTPVVIGLAAGVPLAVLLASRLAAILYSVRPNDPRAWALAFAALLMVAAVAAFVPGRRAVRVPPMQALREE